MTAIDAVLTFCEMLTKKGVRYYMDVIREGGIMVSLAVPGERWEIEFFEDNTVEIERFVTRGVEECDDPIALVMERYV